MFDEGWQVVLFLLRLPDDGIAMGSGNGRKRSPFMGRQVGVRLLLSRAAWHKNKAQCERSEDRARGFMTLVLGHLGAANHFRHGF